MSYTWHIRCTPQPRIAALQWLPLPVWACRLTALAEMSEQHRSTMLPCSVAVEQTSQKQCAVDEPR
jgi:hypothetical protein